VKELLKVAQLLHDAHSSATNDEDADASVSFDLGPGHKFADLKVPDTYIEYTRTYLYIPY